jgi:hypothetical protein
MIHYSCDRCQREIHQHEIRYQIHIEARAALEQTEEEYNDETDHLAELQDILEKLQGVDGDEIKQEIYQRHRYDLCRACYQQFIDNPLNCEQTMEVEFSPN